MTSAMLPPARIAGGLVELTPDRMADGRADAHRGELLAIDGVYPVLAGFIERVDGLETLPIGQCCGRVTASSTLSAIPLPRFDHSAVDGFGIGVEALDCTAGTSVHVIDRVAAGARAPSGRLAAGSSIFLSTGAPIPFGVEAVVMEEKTVPDGSMVHLPACIAPGANIRRAGEDVPAGSVVVPIDVMLDSRHLAILAASGHSHVQVRRRIRIAILSTGDELASAGAALDETQIYDVNGPMLTALASQPWADVVETGHVRDDGALLAARYADLATRVDMIVSSGGAAGSQTDHAARSIVSAGGEARALRVALRPGKPIVIGRIGKCVVVALPGNPVAALVNFLLFGRTAAMSLSGIGMRRPIGQPAIAAADMYAASGRTEFAPAKIVGYAENGLPVLNRLGRGGSARLNPLVIADGLAEIPPPGADTFLKFHAFSSAFSV